jgi:hypothetical protein
MTDESIGRASGSIDLDLKPLRQSVQAAQKPLRNLEQSMERAGTASERSSRLLNLPAQSLDNASQSANRAVRNLRQSSAQLRATGDSAQRAQRGVASFGAGVSGLNGALGALGVSLGAAQFVQFGAQALSAANDLETTQATVRALAGDQATYNEILRLAEDQQRRYGGSLSENIAQLGSLSNSARNAGVGIGEINEAAQRLLVLDPSAQFEDAAIALREALSGDITSLAGRFELSRRELAALTDESLSGAEKLAVLDNLLTDLGATTEAVDARLQTNAQAFRDASAEVGQLTTSLGGLIQRGLTPAARGLGLVANRTNTAISALSDLDGVVQQLQQGTDAYNALSEASREFQGASEDTQSLYQAERDALADLEETQRRQIERIVELEAGLRNPASRLRPELRSAYEEELEQLYEATRTTGDRIEQRSRDLTHVLQAEAEMQAEAEREVALALEQRALQTQLAAGDIDAAMQTIAESSGRTQEQIEAATQALDDMADLERDIVETQENLADAEGAYYDTRRELRQELVEAQETANAALLDAERDYTNRLAEIAADESGAIQDAYQERNDAIVEAQRDLGETLEDISADTNRKLADMAEEGARRESEARRRVEADIGRTLADTRVAAEVNDLEAVGAAPEDRAGIDQREAQERRRFEALQAAQQEAQRFTQQGEAELAGEQFAIRERGIEERLALEESYEEQRQRLIEQGRSDLISELDRERDEALAAIEDRENQAVHLAHMAAQRRQQQREEERQAIIEEGNIRKAAAQEAAQAQIAAAEEAAQKQIAAAQETARIQRDEANTRLQEQQQEISERLSQEQQALAQQAKQEAVNYKERRAELERTLNEQLTLYGQYYSNVIGVNQEQQQALNEALQSEYDTQEQQLSDSMQARLQTVRDYVSDYNAAIGQVEAAESAAAPALVTELPDGEPEPPGRAIGGPVRANAPYIVGERGRELMIPRMDGMVLPNDASERIISAIAAPAGGGGGSPSLTLNAPISISGVSVDSQARMQDFQRTLEGFRASIWDEFQEGLDNLVAQGVPS